MSIHTKISDRLYFVGARYFKFWANFSFRRWKPRVIMITGSAGKTTMLNLIETQLGKKAHYSHNANSPFGIAFDVLGMGGSTGSIGSWLKLIFKAPVRAFRFTHKETFYVVETDGDFPGRAKFSSKWLKPEVSLWVSLGRSHAVCFDAVVKSGKFKTLDDAIASEFASIIKNTQKLAIVDGDNEMIIKYCEGAKAEIKTVSKSSLKSYKVQPNKAVFKFANHEYIFNDPMPQKFTTQLAMLDPFMAYLGLPIKTDLSGYNTPPGRNNYFAGKNGLNIIDSSYNAHIISMQSMLSTFAEMQAKHKWLVVGDIIDQGSIEKTEHKELAKMLHEFGAEGVVLVGRRTYEITYPAMQKLGNKNVAAFKRPDEALAYLEEKLTGKETILFKGSQYLEWIIEKLLANPKDAARLPRQSEVYKKRRAKWGLN